jgi:hypothetical protein
MPRSEFDTVTLSDRSLRVSGTVTFRHETPPDDPMHVAWVVKLQGERGPEKSVGAMSLVDARNGNWGGAAEVPTSWPKAPLVVEAAGTLIIASDERLGRLGEDSVVQKDAVVWTQVVAVKGSD